MKWYWFLLIAGLIVALDQYTKILVTQHMALNSSTSVIPDFFNLVHVHNSGGAFGLGHHYENILRRFLFQFFPVLATGLVVYLYWVTPKEFCLLISGYALIFGGAIGNLIDRFRLGYVIDFLDFYVADYHWYAFNIADSAVTIGVAVFIHHLIFQQQKRTQHDT